MWQENKKEKKCKKVKLEVCSLEAQLITVISYQGNELLWLN